MNPKINPRKALKKVDTLIKENEKLLQKSCFDGSNEKSRLNTRIEGLIRATFIDDNEKLGDYYYDLNSSHITSSNFEINDEILQEDYIRELKIMYNHLLAYKDEIELIIESDKNRFEKFLDLLTKNQIYKTLGLLISLVLLINVIRFNFPNYQITISYITIVLAFIIGLFLVYYILLLVFKKD